MGELDKLVLENHLFHVESINWQIRNVDDAIKKRACADEDVKLLLSLTGIDVYTALLIRSEIGSISRFSDYKKLVTAARDNEKLKTHLKNILNTDMAKENIGLRKQNEGVKEKYNDLVQRFNSNIEDYNELAKENKSLKGRVKDLTNEIGSIYKSAKEFLTERADSLRAFKSDFKELVGKVKEKTHESEFERLDKRERRREQNRGMER